MSDPKAALAVERVHLIQAFGVDISNFRIYLQGIEDDTDEEREEPGVEFRMANRFIKNLDILTGMDPDAPIIISMKTCGGYWEEGMAMYDAIKAAPNPVSIVNYTHARSMSSLIFQAADKRIMMPHSSFMFHEGTQWVGGTAKQVRSSMEFSKVADEQMLDVYVESLKASNGDAKKWSRKKIKDWLKAEMNNKEEVYMTPEQAIKMGFADTVFTSWADVTDYS